MTDKELLGLAAKVMGYTLEEHYDDEQYYPWCTETQAFWNPLLDNGDAFSLMVELTIDMEFWDEFVVAGLSLLRKGHREMYSDDRFTVTRRAIVCAAAEFEKEMGILDISEVHPVNLVKFEA